MFKRRLGKKDHELQFWKQRFQAEGILEHAHYEQFYTTTFGLKRDFYEGKRILDIGCGPRGSLEWANMATERVGLDPLAKEYLKLGAVQHKMSYVNGSSDKIPFPNGYFDVVASFNSLDHVDDLDRTVHEIIRVTRKGGLFLLIVETNHPPTPTEPISLTSARLLKAFGNGFALLRTWCCAMLPQTHDVYGSVLKNQEPISDEDPTVLCASFSRREIDPL